MKILVIPDTQVKESTPTEHLEHIGKYAVEKKPDAIVHLGDHWDMPSLSAHDKVGSKYFEGKRYKADVEAGNKAMSILLQPIKDEQERQKRNKEKVWKPRMEFLLGNHENRISRAVNNNPVLEGVLSEKDLRLDGWNVNGFLVPVFINGVGFNHYWPVGALGRPASSAGTLINKLHQSVVAGHQQGRQVAYGKRADGSAITAIIAGSCYSHDEDYMDQLSNKHWRGVVMLHEVTDGTFDESFVSLNFLEIKYGV